MRVTGIGVGSRPGYTSWENEGTEGSLLAVLPWRARRKLHSFGVGHGVTKAMRPALGPWAMGRPKQWSGVLEQYKGAAGALVWSSSCSELMHMLALCPACSDGRLLIHPKQ